MSITRTYYQIVVGGINVTSTFAPILIDLSVTDKVGTHSDTATIKVDDTDARVRMPRTGDPVTISIGYTTGGAAVVFEGTVDEVKADGNRGSGRTVTVTAKGFDTTARVKEPQQRHFDDDTVQGILDKAAKDADISSVEVSDGLGSVKRKFLEMRDESFLHLGERLAREIGGNFKIKGDKAFITKRNAGSNGSVAATWGVNLMSYSISPKLGRSQFKTTKGRWYDKAEAVWKDTKKTTTINGAKAEITSRFILSDQDEAEQRTDSDKATSERDAGEGSVTIELAPSAQPDGQCIVSVGKAGIDGSYRIETVSHKVSRSGATTNLELKHPEQS